MKLVDNDWALGRGTGRRGPNSSKATSFPQRAERAGDSRRPPSSRAPFSVLHVQVHVRDGGGMVESREKASREPLELWKRFLRREPSGGEIQREISV